MRVIPYTAAIESSAVSATINIDWKINRLRSVGRRRKEDSLNIIARLVCGILVSKICTDLGRARNDLYKRNMNIRLSILLVAIGLASRAFGSISSELTLEQPTVNPADAARDSQHAAEKEAQSQQPITPPPSERMRSFELPAITVTGERASNLREEDRVGPYEQPRWTATRRFPSTRVYVVPEGKVEIEYWLRPTFTRDGDTEIRSLYEIEFGLPYRFQLDLYLRTDQEGDGDEILLGSQFEIRWALADWGKLPGNPTLYLEWVGLEQRPDKVEAKLLLGGEIAPRWHWGSNLVAELETGGEREYEYHITGAISYTLIDEKFSVGAEMQAIFADIQDDRGDFTQTYLLGPSVQFRPLPQMTINFAPLAGFGPDAPYAQVYLNIGYEF